MVRTGEREGIVTITLDSPPSNALTSRLLVDIRKAFAHAAADPSCRCIVFSSAVPKYFSSGLDVSELCAPDKPTALFEELIETHRAIAAAPQPTIAAIEGYALLGGFILALACDWRFVAEESGRVALSEVRAGLSPTSALVRQVLALAARHTHAKELVLRGKTFRGKQAHEAGFVDGVFAQKELVDCVYREARQLSRLAPRAYADIKRALRASVLPDEERLWRGALHDLSALLKGDEAREGVASLKEKRRARWE